MDKGWVSTFDFHAKGSRAVWMPDPGWATHANIKYFQIRHWWLTICGVKRKRKESRGNQDNTTPFEMPIEVSQGGGSRLDKAEFMMSFVWVSTFDYHGKRKQSGLNARPWVGGPCNHNKRPDSPLLVHSMWSEAWNYGGRKVAWKKKLSQPVVYIFILEGI